MCWEDGRRIKSNSNMHIDKKTSQKEINTVWQNEWNRDIKTGPNAFFGQRLFVEGYSVFKKYISEKPGQIILDIGSGTGRYGVKFAKDFPESNIIITDILEESLRVGKKLADYLGVKNVLFKKEDVLCMSFPDNFCDIVFCDVVIQHIPNYPQAVKEMKRVLKPGGRMIVANLNYWNFHSLHKFILKILNQPYEYGFEKNFTKKEMRDLMQSNDLQIIAEDGFYPAYGVYRLKNIYPKFAWFFSFFGKTINRLTKFFDIFTNRYISKNFGIEIIIVAEKK